MNALVAAVVAVVLSGIATGGREVDYRDLWSRAMPFHAFLGTVRAQRDQWHSRFANAAIEAAALTRARALPGRRRILAVAEDGCSDSAWALPYLAKLAAAVPDKLELRVIGRADGARIQSAHQAPDGRIATPTIVVLDEQDRFVGAWVERPMELQKWFIEKQAVLASDDLHEQMAGWYTADGGRSTVREVLAILGRGPVEGK